MPRDASAVGEPKLKRDEAKVWSAGTANNASG
jgi:hypothetical protein